MFGAKRGSGRRAMVARRRRSLDDPVMTGAGCGLIEGTLVAGRAGWVPVETLAPGDEVLTFDNGFQPLTALIRDDAWCEDMLLPRVLWPLVVPAGTLDNREPFWVLPHQGVLIECEDVTDAHGDPYAVAPGAALEALPGVVRQQPGGSAAALLPVFAGDEMVFVNHGALLFCPSHWGLREGILPRNGGATSYRMLTVGAASALLEEMLADPDDSAVA